MMTETLNWISDNFIEVFGAVTGILYVFLEIRQNIWLWPIGITTSAVYIWVFFTSKLYADMSLQVYYLVISLLGWYWWVGGKKAVREQEERKSNGKLPVTRVRLRTAVTLFIVFLVIYGTLWMVLSGLTDSPVPEWDSFITSLSVVATWMLARKIYEHWFLWVVVNTASAILFFYRGLYPTMVLYIIYGTMSVAGLIEWKKVIEPKIDQR